MSIKAGPSFFDGLFTTFCCIPGCTGIHGNDMANLAVKEVSAFSMLADPLLDAHWWAMVPHNIMSWQSYWKMASPATNVTAWYQTHRFPLGCFYSFLSVQWGCSYQVTNTHTTRGYPMSYPYTYLSENQHSSRWNTFGGLSSSGEYSTHFLKGDSCWLFRLMSLHFQWIIQYIQFPYKQLHTIYCTGNWTSILIRYFLSYCIYIV